MRRILWSTNVSVATLLVSCALFGAVAAPARADESKTFIALLNGGQEVPPTTSTGIGVAFMTLGKDKMLCYSLSYLGLTGTETIAHFHSPAAPGSNANVLFGITPPVAIGSPKHACVGPFNKDGLKALKKGQIYVNVHTDAFLGGEIRGQVLRTP
jgi:hypothetical protein